MKHTRFWRGLAALLVLAVLTAALPALSLATPAPADATIASDAANALAQLRAAILAAAGDSSADDPYVIRITGTDAIEVDSQGNNNDGNSSGLILPAGAHVRIVGDADGTTNTMATAQLTRTADFYNILITVESGASLTVENLVLQGKSANYSLVKNYGSLVVESGAHLTGNTSSSSNGAAVFNNFSGILVMNGGRISGNVASSGGAIHNQGSFTMNNGTIDGNSAPDTVGKGGAIYSTSEGKLVLNGGTVKDNSANDRGQDVFLTDYSQLTLSGAPEIGGVYLDTPLTIGPAGLTAGASIGVEGVKTGSVFVKNATAADAAYFTSKDSDRIIVYSGGELLIPLGEAIDSTGGGALAALRQAISDAGTSGATAADPYVIRITGTSAIEVDSQGNNILGLSSGLILPAGAHVRIIGDADGTTDTTATAQLKHTAGFTSVLITVESGASLTVENLVLQGKNASHPLVMSNGSFTIESGAHLTGNTPYGSYGGAVLNNPNGTFTMNGGRISANAAPGGGAVMNLGSMTMNAGLIDGNNATQTDGGGIENNGILTLNGGTISGNTAAGNGNDFHNIYGTSFSLTISGTPVIGSLYLDEYDDLTGACSLTIGTGGLSAGASVGIEGLAGGEVIATGASAGDERYFSNRTGSSMIVAYDSGNLVLAPAPVIPPYIPVVTDVQPSTLTDSATGVSVSGRIGPGAQLKVTLNALHEDCEACSEINLLAALDTENIVFIADISLTGAYQGPLTLTLPADSGYNGRPATVLHCVDGKLESIRGLAVQNGSVSAQVDTLSPFALAILEEETIEPPIPVDPHTDPSEAPEIPKTGHAAAPGAAAALMALAALAALMASRRRKRT